jgi:hypothetical protein
MLPPFISAKDLALSYDYRILKNKYFFILRRSGHWGHAQTQAWSSSLFSPVFFAFFPLPSFSWTIPSDASYMNNYLLPKCPPFILAHPA